MFRYNLPLSIQPWWVFYSVSMSSILVAELKLLLKKFELIATYFEEQPFLYNSRIIRAVTKKGLVKTTKKPLAKPLPAPLPEPTPEDTQSDGGDVFEN